MAEKTIQLEIKRQYSQDAPAVWEKFELAWRPGMNIISVLQEIAMNPVTANGTATTPVTYDCSCLEEICGSTGGRGWHVRRWWIIWSSRSSWSLCRSFHWYAIWRWTVRFCSRI